MCNRNEIRVNQHIHFGQKIDLQAQVTAESNVQLVTHRDFVYNRLHKYTIKNVAKTLMSTHDESLSLHCFWKSCCLALDSMNCCWQCCIEADHLPAYAAASIQTVYVLLSWAWNFACLCCQCRHSLSLNIAMSAAGSVYCWHCCIEAHICPAFAADNAACCWQSCIEADILQAFAAVHDACCRHCCN